MAIVSELFALESLSHISDLFEWMVPAVMYSCTLTEIERGILFKAGARAFSIQWTWSG